MFTWTVSLPCECAAVCSIKSPECFFLLFTCRQCLSYMNAHLQLMLEVSATCNMILNSNQLWCLHGMNTHVTCQSCTLSEWFLTMLTWKRFFSCINALVICQEWRLSECFPHKVHTILRFLFCMNALVFIQVWRLSEWFPTIFRDIFIGLLPYMNASMLSKLCPMIEWFPTMFS